MFLLENKLQSFYEEIKRLNNTTFKMKDNEEELKALEKLRCSDSDSLNVNTNNLTECADTNFLSEKLAAKGSDSIIQRENKKLEINDVYIEKINKAKVFPSKKDSPESFCNKSKHVNKQKKNLVSNNSPSETIIEYEDKSNSNSNDIAINNDDIEKNNYKCYKNINKKTNDKFEIKEELDDISDYSLVNKLDIVFSLLNFFMFIFFFNFINF